MDTSNPALIKHREIIFVALHPNPNQAHTAALLLADVEGILDVRPATRTQLRVSYDLLQVSLEQIEEGLTEAGLHIDNRLLLRLKRALYYYTEEVERTNLGCERGSSNCTRKIFANRYERIEHGCRDQRPEHWRKYL